MNVSIPTRIIGNTHHLGHLGYDWSTRSMGKAIDALYSDMVEIKSNAAKFLDKDFMKGILSRIYQDGPFQPLEGVMTHMFGAPT